MVSGPWIYMIRTSAREDVEKAIVAGDVLACLTLPSACVCFPAASPMSSGCRMCGLARTLQTRRDLRGRETRRCLKIAKVRAAPTSSSWTGRP